MKNLKILLVICIGALLCSVMAFGQGAGTTPPPTPPAKQAPKAAKKQLFACPKCDMASMKGGKCPGCGADMVKISGKVVWACEKCHTMAKKAGNCPMCNAAMARMVHTYGCEACQQTSVKPGKCPKCGKDMKEEFVKMMPKK